MFVVGAIQSALFLGSWNDPFGLIGYYYEHWTRQNYALGLVLLNVIGVGIFVAKALMIVFVQMWLRWTLPRPRIDQVLYACVKVLLPLGCGNFMALAAYLWLVEPLADFQQSVQMALMIAGFAGVLVLTICIVWWRHTLKNPARI